MCQAETERPFDLATGPLFRAQFVRLGPEEHLLIFTAHHLVCDGQSADAILDELRALYAEPEAALDPAPQFRDYALREQSQRGSATEREAIAWWRARFADVPPPLDLPTDFARPAHRTFRGARITAPSIPRSSMR